jgi:gas vesicle protein
MCALLACAINVSDPKVIIDSLGQLSTLIVAIMGFVTAIVVAKVTSGQELKRALCLKRMETYEVATRQLWQLITVYESILATMAATNIDDDSSTIREKIETMLLYFLQLGETIKKNGDLAQIAFYLNLPTHDLIQASKETPKFMKMLKEVSIQLSDKNAAMSLEQIAARVKNSINRFAPLIQEELNHFYNLDAKLKKDIRQDKRLKFLFS